MDFFSDTIQKTTQNSGGVYNKQIQIGGTGNYIGGNTVSAAFSGQQGQEKKDTLDLAASVGVGVGGGSGSGGTVDKLTETNDNSSGMFGSSSNLTKYLPYIAGAAGVGFVGFVIFKKRKKVK
jgi:hypothetical protein